MDIQKIEEEILETLKKFGVEEGLEFTFIDQIGAFNKKLGKDIRDKNSESYSELIGSIILYAYFLGLILGIKPSVAFLECNEKLAKMFKKLNERRSYEKT